MKRLHLICALAVGLFAIAGVAQVDLSPYFARSEPEMDWMKAKWTGDDKPFLALSDAIDEQIANKAKPVELVESYKSAAKREPQDAEAQFAYAYAAWRSTEKEPSIEILRDPAEAMLKPIPPLSYQYSRLLWLLQHKAGRLKGEPQMIGLGKRLLERNPNDDTVKFYLVEELGFMGRSESDTLLGVRYAEEIAKANPQKASSYSLLGGAYGSAFYKTDEISDADEAIANYNRYLKMSPPEDLPYYRGMVIKFIKILERRKAEILAKK